VPKCAADVNADAAYSANILDRAAGQQTVATSRAVVENCLLDVPTRDKCMTTRRTFMWEFDRLFPFACGDACRLLPWLVKRCTPSGPQDSLRSTTSPRRVRLWWRREMHPLVRSVRIAPAGLRFLVAGLRHLDPCEQNILRRMQKS
jgi:hypothetical protein